MVMFLFKKAMKFSTCRTSYFAPTIKALFMLCVISFLSDHNIYIYDDLNEIYNWKWILSRNLGRVPVFIQIFWLTIIKRLSKDAICKRPFEVIFNKRLSACWSLSALYIKINSKIIQFKTHPCDFNKACASYEEGVCFDFYSNQSLSILTRN